MGKKVLLAERWDFSGKQRMWESVLPVAGCGLDEVVPAWCFVPAAQKTPAPCATSSCNTVEGILSFVTFCVRTIWKKSKESSVVVMGTFHVLLICRLVTSIILVILLSGCLRRLSLKCSCQACLIFSVTLLSGLSVFRWFLYYLVVRPMSYFLCQPLVRPFYFIFPVICC